MSIASSKRIYMAASLLVLVAGAMALWNWQYPCANANAACAKLYDPWIAKRYDRDIPLFMSEEYVAGILPETMEPENRNAIASVIPYLQSLAEKKPEPIRKKPVSCAVVGNSGSLYGSKYGNFIDSHDVVFRMNNAPLKGFRDDVGRKTTYHFISAHVEELQAQR